MKKSYSFYKWSIWGILTFSFIIVFIHRLGLSVVTDNLSKDLSMSASDLGNLAAITLYTYAIMQIPVGIMLDYFGPRKICTFGMVTAGVGSMVFGLSGNISFAFLGRFLVGLGTSVICVSILKVQSKWFKPEEFSSASGKMSFLGNLGAMFATFPLAFLVSSVGWRISFESLGVFSILIGIIIYVFVKNSPSEYGFLENEYQEEKVNVLEGIKCVLKNKATWPNFIIMFSFISCTSSMTGLWSVSYLSDVYRVTKQYAAFIVSFFAYGFIFGSLIIGKVTVLLKNNYKGIIMTSSAVTLLLWIIIILVFGGKPPLNFIPVIFFLMGAFVMSHILTFTNVKEVNDIKYSGIAMSINNVGEFLGTALINFFIGIILDYRWTGSISNGRRVYEVQSYKIAFTVFIIMALISFVSAAFIKNSEMNK